VRPSGAGNGETLWDSGRSWRGTAVALHFMHYNFMRVHTTLRVTPAMAAGIASHVWSTEEIVALLH
jgi:hypothetical protein